MLKTNFAAFVARIIGSKSSACRRAQKAYRLSQVPEALEVRNLLSQNPVISITGLATEVETIRPNSQYILDTFTVDVTGNGRYRMNEISFEISAGSSPVSLFKGAALMTDPDGDGTFDKRVASTKKMDENGFSFTGFTTNTIGHAGQVFQVIASTGDRVFGDMVAVEVSQAGFINRMGREVAEKKIGYADPAPTFLPIESADLSLNVNVQRSFALATSGQLSIGVTNAGRDTAHGTVVVIALPPYDVYMGSDSAASGWEYQMTQDADGRDVPVVYFTIGDVEPGTIAYPPVLSLFRNYLPLENLNADVYCLTAEPDYTNNGFVINPIFVSSGQSTQAPQGRNGIDDDGDGLVDFPNDPGLTSATDNDEFNAIAMCFVGGTPFYL